MAKIPWPLANKKRIYELDPGHPYAGAVVNPGAQEMPAPAEVIARVYNAPELEPHKVRLSVLSRQYFSMKRALAEGVIPAREALDDLSAAVKILAEDYRNSSIVKKYSRRLPD